MEEVDVIYNRKGEPQLRLLDNERIVNFQGKSMGFLSGDDIYDYSGNHRGWYIEGILRDHYGKCVGFGEETGDTPHPFIPFKSFKPFPGFVEFEPFRPFKEFSPYKPLFTMDWSKEGPLSIFKI